MTEHDSFDWSKLEADIDSDRVMRIAKSVLKNYNSYLTDLGTSELERHLGSILEQDSSIDRQQAMTLAWDRLNAQAIITALSVYLAMDEKNRLGH